MFVMTGSTDWKVEQGWWEGRRESCKSRSETKTVLSEETTDIISIVPLSVPVFWIMYQHVLLMHVSTPQFSVFCVTACWFSIRKKSNATLRTNMGNKGNFKAFKACTTMTGPRHGFGNPVKVAVCHCTLTFMRDFSWVGPVWLKIWFPNE